MTRIILSIGLLALAAPAIACSRKAGPPSLEENFSTAREVFIAHITSVHERDFPRSWGGSEEEPNLIEARYTLKEALKGSVPKSGKLYDAIYNSCSIGLMAGWDYVVFIQPIQDGPQIRFVGMFSGSFPLVGAEAQGDLAAIRLLAQKEIKTGSKK